MGSRTVLWAGALLLLLSVLVPLPVQAVTGFSNSTCVEPITDERLEVIDSPTPIGGEAFGQSLAARGHFLAIVDDEQIEGSNFVDVFRRNTVNDQYGPSVYQILTAPFLPSTSGRNDLAINIAMDDTWLVTCGTNGTHIFDYDSGTELWSHFQSIPYIGGVTTGTCVVYVFCNRILVKITGTTAYEQYAFDSGVTDTWIPFPGQATLPTITTGVSEAIWNEPLREFLTTDTGGFNVYGMESCCSPLVATQPFIVTPSGNPDSIGIDIADRVAVSHTNIDTVHIYDRTIAGTYPVITQTLTGVGGSSYGLGLVFSEVDGALLVSAPLELVSAVPLEFGRYYSYHETAGSYVLFATYTQSTPISYDPAGIGFGITESRIPAQPCGDYVFAGERFWENNVNDEVGRVQTFCLSDKYCCGTCGNTCDLDDNICTVDLCVETPIYGNLTHTMGVCTAGPALDVDDGNQCTIDTCDPVLGARHEPMYGGVCFDDTGCFTGVCDCGTCVNATTPIDCSDGDICTDDICLPGGICFNPLNMTICPTPSPTPSPSTTPSSTRTPSTTASASSTSSNTATPTPSVSPGASASNTPSTSLSNTQTPTSTATSSTTPSSTPSITPSPSGTPACNPNLCPMSVDECQVPVCINGTTCGFDSAPTEGFACGLNDADACVFNFRCVAGTCTALTNITDADCDDGNECTIDSCDPNSGCVHDAAAAAGDSCTPLGGVLLDVCYLDGICDGFGGCIANVTGSQVDCDDGHNCTFDWCDSVAGCLHIYNNTLCVQDNNDCTRNICTDSGCITVNEPDGSDCSDGYSCTTNDACSAGVCVGTGDSDLCPDTDQCNVGVCDIGLFVGANGTGCVDLFAAPGEPCPDLGNECLRDGVCDGVGSCSNFTVLDCNDFNSCTDQVCDPILGCIYTPEPIGSACTFATNGTCFLDGECTGNGTCIVNPFGPHMDCDDGLTCTIDRCDLDVGCFFEANHTACASLDSGHQCTEYICDPNAAGPGDGCVIVNKANGTFCTEVGNNTCSVNGQCIEGACIATPLTSLCPFNASNPCEAAECSAGTDLYTGDTVTACSVGSLADGSFCVSGEETECLRDFECSSGICAATTNVTAADCDDGNECTIDLCDPILGCTHTPVAAGTSCAGLNVTTNICFLDSICNDIGQCVQNVTGTQINCDDGIDCTIDRCDSVSNCTHTADHEFCGETGNFCTEFTCDLTLGCVANNVTDGTPCNDFVGCSGNDACVQGRCVGEPFHHRCPDLNDCSTGFCLLSMAINGTTGMCSFTNETAGTSCGAEDECNKDLECDGMGTCVAQTVLDSDDCDDGNPCTVDSCDVDKGCVHESLSLNGTACGAQVFNTNGTCFLNNTCDGFGSCLPDIGASTVDCNDGVNCTLDICDGIGTCQHIPVSENCPPNPGPCSEYICDLSGGCLLVNATDGTGCSDGLLCTSDDTCQAGVCVGTPTDELCPDIDECVVGVCAPFHGSSDPLGCIPGFLIGFPSGVPCPSFDTECAVGGVCDGTGACVNQTDISSKCEDFNSCTEDVCHPVTGCSNAPGVPAGTPCQTAAFGLCFLDAVCSVNGTCVTDFTGATTSCNDTIACTIDTCDSVNNCTYTEDDSFCASLTPSGPCKKFVCDSSAPANTTGCVEVDMDEGDYCVEYGGECSVNGQCSNDGRCIAEANDGACPWPEGFPCREGFCNVTTSGANGTISFCDTRDRPDQLPCLSPNQTECIKDFECNAGVCEAQVNTTDADCNDFNPCTVNVCDPELGCTSTNLPYGTDCGFLNITTSLCFLDSICDGLGACVANLAGPQLNCSDAIECTVDGCDSVSNCTNVPDHSYCPDTGNPCTQNLCSGTSGTGCEITAVPDGTFCPAPGDDECSTNFQCQTGVCTGVLEDNLCDDTDFCNIGSCAPQASGNATIGVCTTQFAANGTFCGDNDGCNFDLRCDGAGTCNALTVITNQDCIDQAVVVDGCSITECRPYYGCVSCPNNQNQTCTSTPFQDDLCFLETVCNDYAQCVWDVNGDSMDCPDAYDCTEDVCDSVLGCLNIPRDDLCAQPVFGCARAVCDPLASTDSTGCVLEKLPNNTRCNDGYTCTDNDICLDGVCVGTVQDSQCPNDLVNDCIVGFCNPVSREPNFDYYLNYWNHTDPQGFELTEVSGCEFQDAVNNTKCYSTLDECSRDGLCLAGVCEPQTILNGTDCDDGNDCTVDTCDGQLGCRHTPVAYGSPCAVISDVDHRCFVESQCNDFGTCVPNINGNITDCEPPALCMESSCDSVYGCIFTANHTKCPTSGAGCHEWLCMPELTTDPSGCAYVPREAGSECETGSACLVDGRCDDNAVCSGKPMHSVCEKDGLECSVDLCSEDPYDTGVDEFGCLPSQLLKTACRPRDSCMQDGTCNADTFECEGSNPIFCETNHDLEFGFCIEGECFFDEIEPESDDCGWFYFKCIWIWLLFGVLLIAGLQFLNVVFGRWMLSRMNNVDGGDRQPLLDNMSGLGRSRRGGSSSSSGSSKKKRRGGDTYTTLSAQTHHEDDSDSLTRRKGGRSSAPSSSSKRRNGSRKSTSSTTRMMVLRDQ